MCLNTGGSGGRTIIKQEPILPGPASTDDKVNDAVVTNITDRSKQKQARGQFRDYGGLDANRTFDEKAATGRKDYDEDEEGSTAQQRSGGTRAKARAKAGAAAAKASHPSNRGKSSKK